MGRVVQFLTVSPYDNAVLARDSTPRPDGGPAAVIPGPPKPSSASRVSLAILTHPGQANFFGTIHGGVILRLADECGAAAALRHAECAVITTVAIDSMTFLAPVRVGDRVEVVAEVTYAGRTSMEAQLEVFAEPMARAERRRVGLGFGVYVALDASGTPCPVPPLLVETDEDRRRAEAAQARQALRLARREEARRSP
jgi:uncharacterized protein (TIGR00369 family)